jgi:hypothetical protein
MCHCKLIEIFYIELNEFREQLDSYLTMYLCVMFMLIHNSNNHRCNLNNYGLYIVPL